MEITILKARRITSSIDRLLKDLLPIATDRYGFRSKLENEHFVYENVEDAAEAGNIKVSDIISEYEELVAAKYHLRSLIGKFNSNSEISELQTQSKEIEAINAGLVAATKKYQIPSFDTANNKFSVGCSEEYIKSLKKKIQKNNDKIQTISDNCAEINLTNKVCLSADCVSVLKNYDLLG